MAYDGGEMILDQDFLKSVYNRILRPQKFASFMFIEWYQIYF